MASFKKEYRIQEYESDIGFNGESEYEDGVSVMLEQGWTLEQVGTIDKVFANSLGEPYHKEVFYALFSRVYEVL